MRIELAAHYAVPWLNHKLENFIQILHTLNSQFNINILFQFTLFLFAHIGFISDGVLYDI